MIIKEIKFTNFRQFKDATIDFSQDPDKNVTVILGDNTTGKTTLIRGFIWCLYGKNSFKQNKIALNHDVQAQLKSGETSKAIVSISLEHDGYLYDITTTEEFKKNDGKIISLSNGKPRQRMMRGKNGNFETVREDLIYTYIQNILPDDLTDYFFFDGEDNSIETITKKSNLTDAVSNLLGLKNVESLMDVFNPAKSNSVYSSFNDDLIKKNDGVTGYLQNDINDIREEINNSNEKIDSIKKQIHVLEEDIGEKTQLIEVNQDAADDEKRLQEAQRNLINAQGASEEEFEGIINALNAGDSLLDSLFSASFQHYDLQKVLDSSSFKSENSYHDITGKAVDELIKRGRCLCGAVIEDGNVAYKHLQEAKMHMEPIDYGGYASSFRNMEQMNGSLAIASLNKISDKLLDCKQELSEIESYSDNIKALKKKLLGREDVGKLEEERRTYENQLEIQQGYLKQETENIQRNTDKLKEKMDELAKASEDNEHNREVHKAMNYCSSIYNIAKKYLDKQKEKVRGELESEVNLAFNRMYSGSRGVSIDPNFRFRTYLKEASSEKVDDSGGLATVTNFSFVAGLISLAKRRILSNGVETEIEDTTPRDENYPLVMDAPFSKTDTTHIRNICKVMPTYCNQLVMALMEKDYKEAEPELNPKVGNKYRLIKISETETKIEKEQN